jgi:hypothetical protein
MYGIAPAAAKAAFSIQLTTSDFSIYDYELELRFLYVRIWLRASIWHIASTNAK